MEIHWDCLSVTFEVATCFFRLSSQVPGWAPVSRWKRNRNPASRQHAERENSRLQIWIECKHWQTQMAHWKIHQHGKIAGLSTCAIPASGLQVSNEKGVCTCSPKRPNLILKERKEELCVCQCVCVYVCKGLHLSGRLFEQSSNLRLTPQNMAAINKPRGIIQECVNDQKLVGLFTVIEVFYAVNTHTHTHADRQHSEFQKCQIGISLSPTALASQGSAVCDWNL